MEHDDPEHLIGGKLATGCSGKQHDGAEVSRCGVALALQAYDDTFLPPNSDSGIRKRLALRLLLEHSCPMGNAVHQHRLSLHNDDVIMQMLGGHSFAAVKRFEGLPLGRIGA